jgi:ankyrin repeat protein
MVCVPADVMRQDEIGHSPLHSAARSGNAGAVQVLIEARCDPMLQDWRGWTALHIAAHRGETTCVEVMLSLLASRVAAGAAAANKGAGLAAGREPDSARQLARVVDGLGRSALHVWSYSREKRRHGNELEAQRGWDQRGPSQAFKMLVQASSSVFSHQADGGRTQLHACGAGGAAWQWICMAETLEGVDMCARERSSEGRSAVAVAASTGNTAVVEAYVQGRMGPLSLTDARGRTLLDLVCSRSLALHSECLREIWDSVRVLDRWPVRPSLGFIDLLNCLGRRGRMGIVDGGQGAGQEREMDQILADESLLSLACCWGDVAVVERLLDLGASPDAASARLPRESVASSSTSAGARAAQASQARDGKFPLVGVETPVVVACRRGDEKLLRLLVQRGHATTDILAPCAALHESVRRTVEEGAPARASWCRRGLWACGRETPLVTCVRHGHVECAQVLVESGCSCDTGWVRDPFAAAALQECSPAKALSGMIRREPGESD